MADTFESPANVPMITQDEYDVVVVTGRHPKLLQYPIHNIQKHNAWVMFEEVTFDEHGAPEDFSLDKSNVYPEETKFLGLTIPNKNNAKRSLRQNYTNNAAALYLPGSVQVSDGASYSDVDIGSIGYRVMQKVRQGAQDGAISAGDVGDAAVAGIKELLKPIVDVTTGVATNNVPVSALTKLLQSVKGLSPEFSGAVSAGLRHIANPHTHSIFQGVQLRSFTFTFEFFPEDKAEAEEVRRIIQFFRSSLYPEKHQDSSFPEESEMTLRFPTMMWVRMGFIHPVTGEFKTELDDGTPFAFKIKPCYITQVSTTFDNNNTLAIHSDGHFLSASMVLTLQEEVTLTKEDVVAGH